MDEEEASFEIDSICGGPFETNAYMIADEATRHCALIDPGYDADKEWGPVITRNGLHLDKIILTHGHIDHTSGVAAMARAFPDVPILIHREDEALLTSFNIQVAQMLGLPPFETIEPTEYLVEGEPISVGQTVFDVLHVPGHTPGHIALLNGNTLVSGDVIFDGSIGRTDLPGGDFDTLMESIRSKILNLPDETMIYSGHGPTTTVGKERRTNPFVLQFLRS